MKKKIYIISVVIIIIILALPYSKITENKKESSLQSPTIKEKVQSNTEKIEWENTITKNETNTFNKKIELSETTFSSNIDNLIKVNGSNNEVKNISIWKNSFEIKTFKWETFIEIEKYTMESWDYDVLFHLKNWKILKYDEKIHLWEAKQKNIFIQNITPNKLNNNKNSYIVLQWLWFKKIISIQLSNNIVLTQTNFEIINDNVMSILIPKWLKWWKYSMNLMTTDGIYQSELQIEVINK
jgi:hypothetical protein